MLTQRSEILKYTLIAADVDEETKYLNTDGHYTISIKCSDKNLLQIGAERNIQIEISKCTEDEMKLVVTSTLSTIFVSEYQILANRFKKVGDVQGEEQRVMKYSGEYQLVYSLVVANPNDFTVSWQINDAIQRFALPLVRQFENITTIKVSSLVQNYASLTHIPPKKDNQFVLYAKDLTIYLNSAEWNLGSVVSLAPAVNFVLYIPEKEVSPLQILHADGTAANSNAFMISQWGGVKIHNLFPKKSENVRLTIHDLHPIMEVFGEQLRVLLGIEPVDSESFNEVLPNFAVTVENDGIVGVTRWEMDRLLRTRTMYNVLDAISTLHSLERLLDNLQAIPVYDHVAKTVRKALESFHEVTIWFK